MLNTNSKTYQRIVKFLNSNDKNVCDYRYYLSNACCSKLKMRLRKQWTHINLDAYDNLRMRSYNRDIGLTDEILEIIWEDILKESYYCFQLDGEK